uniref:SUEL-type lectin domain-containing protein n=1 Tax=Amphilophus citrinellus TaxID=61819 RepID=A0A3Q0RPP2_AMPCI
MLRLYLSMQTRCSAEINSLTLKNILSLYQSLFILIAVYSAMFGRTLQGTLDISKYLPLSVLVPECQSSVALQVLTARCQGKKTCLIRASTREFGDPCYAGTRKYLSVIYTCGESPKKPISMVYFFLPPGGDVC